jgi:hypothetical protein
MYDFIKLDKEERSQAFRIASERLGYPAYSYCRYYCKRARSIRKSTL